MRDGAYRKRLSDDLPKWREAGWVTPDGVTAILAALPEGRAVFGMAAIVGTLGALLIGLGIIAFVASGWETMPRIVRFILLIAALAISYLAAGALLARGFRLFSEAALLLAGLVFAASIALIGQTYHLSGDFSGAILLFEAGVIGGALLAASPTLAVLGLVGAGYWVWFGSVETEIVPHLPSLVAVLLAGAVVVWQDARHARIVAVLAFGFWVAVTVFGFAFRDDWPYAGTLALLSAAAFAVWGLGAALTALAGRSRLQAIGDDLFWMAPPAYLAALGFLQIAALWSDDNASSAWLLPSVVLAVVAALLALFAFMRKRVTALEPAALAAIAAAAVAFAVWDPGEALPGRLAGGVIVLAAALWVTNLGQAGDHPRLKTLGLFAFGAEVFYLYVVTLGTQIDTAAAFFVGGILFIALAYGLYRLDRRLSVRAAGKAP